MNEAELIARLAKKNAELEIKVCELQSMIDRALGQIYCIGGPLNDNRLGYNKEQLAEWWRVKERLESNEYNLEG